MDSSATGQEQAASMASKPKQTTRNSIRRYAIVAAVLLLVVISAALVLGHFAPRLLETEKLRKIIAARTGRELGGSTGVHPLQTNGFNLHSSGLVVSASPPRALTELRAHNLSASFSLIELWRGKWRINHIYADHLQAAYGKEASRLIDRTEFPTPDLIPPAEKDSLMSVDIRKVSLARADLFWADPQKEGGQLRDVETTLSPNGKNLNVEGRGGTLRQAQWPEARVSSFKLYYAKPNLRIDEGHLTLGEHGRIDVKGSFAFEEKAALDLQLNFAQCPIAPFINKGHANKLDGTFVGDVHLQKVVNSEEATADGKARAEAAVVKNVQALEKAAAFTGKSQLSPLHLDTLRADYHFEGKKLTVRNFEARANHVLNIQGTFTYKEGEIDGNFELGVAPDIVDKFPGARQEVFTRAEDDYLWTKVKLTGTLDNPKDDLKPRLMAALEKHVAFGFLKPLIKPGEAAREVIGLIFPMKGEQ